MPVVVIAQHKEAIQLQQQITDAVAKARPACVRIWGYDTLLHQRNSAQFSGVVVKDSYILTAAHVVTPTNTYRVMFADGSDCIAVALGKIELSEDKTRPDVALMKIVTRGNWPFAEIGSSASLQPHAACISIAYPESLNLDKPTVRLGVVTDPLNDRGFIKSSCIMEPGDSGGPLFDIDGHVIGIHSAIEVSEKNNYDVPVDVYMKHWQALLTATTYHALPPQNALTSAIIPKLKTYAVLKPEDIAAFKTTNQIPAVVAIESRANNKVRRILGTVISLRGTPLEKTMGTSVIISKSSMVDDSVIVIFSPEKRVRAKVGFRDKTNDLVLLHPSSPINGGITFKQFDANIMAAMTPGAFLISPQVDTAAAVSILGSADTELPKVSSAGFSGATAAKSSKPAKIYFVRPGSPAALAGIKTGDVVNQVGLTHIDSATAYATAMSTYWPGDTVSLHIKRENQELHFALLLTYPPLTSSSHPAEHFAGGKSRRRDGFTHVYTNDAVLKPEQCGGPVFNLKGEFCGTQIARYSRANSLLLPAEVLRAFINTAYGNAKMELQSNRQAK
ncbi:trypsin-like peptidase domain-containing protein [Mucilaginibacter sp. CSA2-8R]|uniref:trypsin-like peptidase domain-containing protein n=1 Tax=Mucilaginibacter sp. CSA2-8R TaxID=3141542 RepID=UPI00315D9A0B